MDAIVIKLIESSVSAALLMVVLWVFLPRLIKSIDDQASKASKEHEALILMLTHIEIRLNWHEAKVYGVNPSVGDSDDQRYRQAAENFQKAEGEVRKLRADIHRVFGLGRTASD